MKPINVLISAVLLWGFAIQSHSAVFVLPIKIDHFVPSPFLREPDLKRMDTWEPPHIMLTNFTSIERPVWIANAKDGSGRLFVVQQSGAVVIVGNSTPFINLEPNFAIPIGGNAPLNPQVRLVSMAFPPDYFHKGYFYVSYYDLNGRFKVSRFYISTNNPDVADQSSEEVIGSNYDLGCNGGQIVFSPDGTLYLNLAGPIANEDDLDALSGKMLALLKEDGKQLPTDTEPYWPFSQYFSSTDCSEIGGEFAERSGDRMNGVYFYGDDSGTIWGLKFNGTDWVKYDLASPTFAFSPSTIGTSPIIILPPPPITLPLPPVGDPSNGLTLLPPITLLSNPPPISVIGPIALVTNGGGPFAIQSAATTVVAPSAMHTQSISTSITSLPAAGQVADAMPEYPFIITAFGQDEEGRLYIANYGAPYYVQDPPSFHSVEEFGGGGIYLIQDDLLEYTVHEVVLNNRVTLEWQSASNVRYRIQESSGSSSWFDIRPEMKGDGRVLSVSELPYNLRIAYQVIAITPGTAD